MLYDRDDLFLYTIDAISRNIVNYINKEGDSLLHLATKYKRKDIVEILLENEAEVDVKDNNFKTPLYIASQLGLIDIVNILLKNGANPNIFRDSCGSTPVFIAAQNGHSAVLTLLLNHGGNPNSFKFNGASALFIATVGEHFHCVNLLLKYRASPNDKTFTKDYPLTLVWKHNKLDTARLLIQNGSIIDDPNHEGQNPLWLAIFYENYELMKLLLQVGAKSIADKDGFLPIHLLFTNGKTKYLSLFTKNRDEVANMKIKDCPCLIHLLLNNFAPIEQIHDLINNWKVDPNQCALANIKGNQLIFTPIVVATIRNDIESLKLLVALGADINFQRNGMSLVGIGIQSNIFTVNIETICVLRELGANNII